MSLKKAAEQVRSAGRGEDTELVHFTKGEVNAMKGLAKAAGGKLTRNPETGMMEAGFLRSMLPTILGFAANFVVPGSGLAVGALTGAAANKEDPLMGAFMGGLGGYGGGSLAAGLQGAGTAAAQGAASAGTTGAAGLTTGSTGLGLASGSTGLGFTVPSAAAQAQAVSAAQGAAANQAALPAFQQASQGLSAAFNNPQSFVSALGGGTKALTAAGMAAAPALMMQPEQQPEEDPGEIPKYDFTARPTGEFFGRDGDFSTRQRNYFTEPTFTRRMAEGGEVMMAEGGFVIPADVVSMAGNGSSDAGLEALAQMMGAQPIDGPGDGQSDDIPASIDGTAPARVARQEAYIPPETVAKLGGADKLYSVIERIRKMAHGTSKQQRPVDLERVMS